MTEAHVDAVTALKSAADAVNAALDALVNPKADAIPPGAPVVS